MPELRFAKPRRTYAPPQQRMEPIHPELISPSPETLLNATVGLLREHLPSSDFNIQTVTDHEAVITHYTKDHRVEFFRIKVTR